MKTKIFQVGFIILISWSTYAQSDSIPNDPDIKQGRLPNGFTYYIKNIEKPGNRIYLDLIVKAGHDNETEAQVELAHLLEHMPFTGTKHFPDPYQYFESHGLKRGIDVNAHTAGRETTYNLRIPPGNKDLFQGVLLFLRDCAQGMIFDSVKINNERSVVAMELKGKTDYTQEFIENYSAKLYQVPASRTSKNHIRNLFDFNQEELIRFYKRWYRPDLQAIVIVGNVNVDQVEQMIRKLFKDMRNPLDQNDYSTNNTKLNPSNEYILVADERVGESSIRIFMGEGSHIFPTTMSNYTKWLQVQLFNHILEKRFEELIQQPKSKITQGKIYYASTFGPGDLNGLHNLDLARLCLSVNFKDSISKQGFRDFVTELERVRRYGFLAREVEDAKQELLKRLLERNNGADASSIADRISDLFVLEVPVPAAGLQFEITNNLIRSITAEDIHQQALGWFNNYGNTDIVVQVPDKLKDNLPQKEFFFHSLDSIKLATIQPFEYATINTIMDNATWKRLNPRKPSLMKRIKNVDVTQLAFSNGISIYLKPLGNDENGITYINGFKCLSIVDSQSKKSLVDGVASISKSGLGQLDPVEFIKHKKKNNIYSELYADERYIRMGGYTRNGIEPLMQVIYLYCTQPKIDLDGVDNASELSKQFRQYIQSGELSFSIVGNFDIDSVIVLCEQYFGNIPAVSNLPSECPNPVAVKAKQEENIIYDAKPGIANVILHFTENIELNYKSRLELTILSKVLSGMLIRDLRGKNGGVYGVFCSSAYNPMDRRFYLTINFESDDLRYQEMIDSVWKNIDRLKTTGLVIKLFNLSKKLVIEDIMNEKEKPDFWISYLESQIVNGRDLNEMPDFTQVLEKINRIDIHKAAQIYLSKNFYSRQIRLPEVAKPLNRLEDDFLSTLDCSASLDSLAKIIKANLAERTADSLIKLMKINCYWKNNDFSAYITALISYRLQYAQNRNAGELNNDAWKTFRYSTKKEELHIALAWSKRSIDMLPEQDAFGAFDTYANILYKLGNTEEAIKWEQKALDTCPENWKKIFQPTLEKMQRGEPTWINYPKVYKFK